MPTITQKDRALRVTTPLGEDILLVTGLRGTEALNQLYNFQIDLISENRNEIAFDKIVGKAISVAMKLAEGGTRHFHGIVNRFSEAERDETFTTYRAEIVPQFWLLTRRAQSRIFQHKTVPDILREVLDGLDISLEIQGTFEKRDYCVQYRESDFNFASRLMEEEGIFYFFKHSEGSHTMVLGNTPPTNPEVPDQTTAIYEGIAEGERLMDRVYDWLKSQELRSGKYTLWDHCFELPHKHVEAEKLIVDTVAAGTVTHKLKIANNDKLELYDFPGHYADRFDGVDPGGGDRPADIQKIFQDNSRTVAIRMEQEAVRSVRIQGFSTCRQFIAGHKFKLERHFNADGAYLITSVSHQINFNDYRSAGDPMFYENEFTCIPAGIPFRPAQVSPKPTVQGTQTAVVVGPAGEEIFTDKYSRVKVQFHWDREGRNNADSSCWVRVGTSWAGKNWGVIHIPRIGQEVIVDFLEGDPNNPIIVGSVYNADMMPPYGLPGNKTQSGVKSRSSLKGSPANFNEIRFEDKKGSEQVFIHAEKNQDIEVENDETHWVGHDRTKTIDHDETTYVKNNRTETVNNNETITIGHDRSETVLNNETIVVAMQRDETVGTNETVTVGIDRSLTVGASQSHTIGVSRSATIGASDSLLVGGAITETCGGNLTITAGAVIAITSGTVISIMAATSIAITAPVLLLNGRPVLPVPAPI